MKRSRNSQILAYGVLMIVVSVLLVGLFGLAEKYINKVSSQKGEEDGYSYTDGTQNGVYYGGHWYSLRSNMETVLVMGIDSIMSDDEQRVNSQQADFLLLLIVDKMEKSLQVLHINRDTMVNQPQTDAYGRPAGSRRAQLTLAHTVGDTDKDRCRNTVKAVEDLLYGIRIDHYLSVTMDAIPVLNDSVGGVSVCLLDDFTCLDESFTKGEVVTLRGSQALGYVRERGALENSTNLHRMERQRQYIAAFFEQYSKVNPESTLDTMLEINEYMVSDCTVNQLSRLLDRVLSYSHDDILTIEGESTVGSSGYVEFYVDETELQNLVLNVFYKCQE